MLCPSPDSCRALDFGSSMLPPSSHSPNTPPKRVPPTPATQSTDQEGITIFMLRVTGIRGLWRKQCFSSSTREENLSHGKQRDQPSRLQLQDTSPKGRQQVGATRPSLGAAR